MIKPHIRQLRFVVIVGILIFTLASLSACSERGAQDDDLYPWKITLLENGGSRIFGIEPGRSNLAQAIERIQQTPQLSLFEIGTGSYSLEAFFPEAQLGGLSARIILTLYPADGDYSGLHVFIIQSEEIVGGGMQHKLGSDALQIVQTAQVSSLTYIPYANLSPQVILQRFGEPAERIRTHEKAEHFLYPELGLDLIHTEEGKEVLQYVAPRDFDKLRRPLLEQEGQNS